MLPKGFFFDAVQAGIKYKNKFDLGLFHSDTDCVCSAMFTANRIKAAPIIVSNRHLHKTGRIRAIISNSGCANACTGRQGIKDARQMCKLAADKLNVLPEQVLVASTGVIGTYLPMQKIKTGVSRMDSKSTDFINAVNSIMTTDTAVKIESKQIRISGKTVTILGCTKGAGMIKPNLVKLSHATMLCYIFTDCAINSQMLDKILLPAVNNSFNLISVDGDMSTNDTVFLMANGKAGNKIINKSGKEFNMFNNAVTEVCLNLAKKMVQDGEGATKFVQIEVVNTDTAESAKKIAVAIANSALVKTAIFGGDPNWGRIMGALGTVDNVKYNPGRIDVYLNRICVCKNSQSVRYNEPTAIKLMQNRDISIKIDMHAGGKSVKYYTSDLSLDYVKINSHYRT